MNATEIYNRAIKVYTQQELDDIERKRSENSLEESLKDDIRDKWLEHPLTVKLIETLNEQRNKLLVAVESSAVMPSSSDIGKMSLVQSHTIKSIVNFIVTGKFN